MREKIHYAHVTMAEMHVVVIQVKVFGGAIMCGELQHAGKARHCSLSSLTHLPTYNIHDRAVYFHINKAHPFKLRGEFNLEAGLSAISTIKKIQPLPAPPAHYFRYI